MADAITSIGAALQDAAVVVVVAGLGATAAMAAGLGPAIEPVHHWPLNQALERQRIGQTAFDPVGETMVEQPPLRVPSAATPHCTWYEMSTAYYKLCRIAEKRARKAGRAVPSHYAASHFAGKAALGAEIDRLMRKLGVDSLPRKRAPNYASVPRLAVGTLMCALSDRHGYQFARIASVAPNDGSLRLDLFETERLECRQGEGLLNWYRRRVVRHAPLPPGRTAQPRVSKRRRMLDDAYREQTRDVPERIIATPRPTDDGKWEFSSTQYPYVTWGLWIDGFEGLAPGDEYAESLWED